jgi:hypothetical protein
MTRVAKACLRRRLPCTYSRNPLVHKIVSGVHAFKILLNADDGRYFDLTYIYDADAKSVDGIKIVALPQGWELIVIGRGLLLQIPTASSANAAPRQMCAVAFSLDNPFFARVMLR